MRKLDIFKLLSRNEKWFLGGGNRLLYAPPFPMHLAAPGLWDTAHYYNYAFQPLFAYTLLTDEGLEVPLRHDGMRWSPDRWRRRFTTADRGISIEEGAFILPFDVAVCTVKVRNASARRRSFRLVGWTAREHHPGQAAWLSDVSGKRGTAVWTNHLHPYQRPAIEMGCAFGCSGPGVWIADRLSEGTALLPSWSHTPFAEPARRGALPAGIESGGITPEGILWIATERSIRVPAKGAVTVHFGFAAAPTSEEARNALATAIGRDTPVDLSSAAWKDHFDGVPFFRCSDPHLTSAYWYRWYGLRLNTIYGGEGNYEHPAVCEGIDYFRAPISYSAPCHMLENRWMSEPELARGSLLTFLHNQRKDGSFRGYIDINHYRSWMQGASEVEPFYHANWGRAVLAVDAVHPSLEFLEAAYVGLKAYAAYFDRERDEEVSGLYDIDNHYETGQEYMHRYTVVDPNADRDNWGKVFRLKGVDVTVYLYETKRALALMADRLGREDESSLWTLEADRTRDAVRERMWDADQGMFFDIDPRTGLRTGVKAATCFYPYFTDIVKNEHLRGMKRHLFSRKEFWTPWPVPSTSKDDPTFSAEPHWKGKRMNCPWNGRVWPMTNSHIMDALATAAVRFGDRQLERKAGEFLLKFIRMMFFDQDPARPNSFEHYNPLTGQPSAYRGVDDYMHSWVNDLIIRYVMGIQPEADLVRVRPLRMGILRAEIRNVAIREHRLDVLIARERFTVTLDGKKKVSASMGKQVEIQV